MAETKFEKRIVHQGFGFPVVLRNVPMLKVRGAWTPRIDYNVLARELSSALAHKPARLTGSEIRFLRQQFELTLEAFGARFDVSHPAVLKWERAGDQPPALKWPVEKDIRLFVVDQLGARPKAFKELYQELREAPRSKEKPIEVDLGRAA